jgi:lipoyl(octanoyl) transferase|tara:strand:- start:793 stop:1449 length:657 start_codon:yes stop_codon:yes gene_type:complete
MKNKVEWKISKTIINYDDAISLMEDKVLKIKQNIDKELVWLLEHGSIYTAGTSAKEQDMLNKKDVLVRYTGRGGQWTWHGPGQRVAYVMLDLKKRLPDVRAYVNALEEWIILTLRDFNLEGTRLEQKPGVWIKNNDNSYNKIAALGVRISSWVTWHGISINLNPDLNAFENIVPCGILNGSVTSFKNLDINVSMNELDQSLIKNFNIVFGDGGLFKLR